MWNIEWKSTKLESTEQLWGSGQYHFGRSVSDLARACLLDGRRGLRPPTRQDASRRPSEARSPGGRGNAWAAVRLEPLLVWVVQQCDDFPRKRVDRPNRES